MLLLSCLATHYTTAFLTLAKDTLAIAMSIWLTCSSSYLTGTLPAVRSTDKTCLRSIQPVESHRPRHTLWQPELHVIMSRITMVRLTFFWPPTLAYAKLLDGSTISLRILSNDSGKLISFHYLIDSGSIPATTFLFSKMESILLKAPEAALYKPHQTNSRSSGHFSHLKMFDRVDLDDCPKSLCIVTKY